MRNIGDHWGIGTVAFGVLTLTAASLVLMGAFIYAPGPTAIGVAIVIATGWVIAKV